MQQQQSDSCTLCSSAMMIRRALYLTGDSNWDNATEGTVGKSAWTSIGLSWQWEYVTPDVTFICENFPVVGIGEYELLQFLMEHPEGIVLYCGGSESHGVLLTDYADGVFFCADPADGYSGREIPLAESLLGSRHGTQADILESVTALWLVTESSLPIPKDPQTDLRDCLAGGGEIAAERV